VTLIASNLSVQPPRGIEVVDAPTAEDLARETLSRADSDVVVMAAAVSDYRPAETLEGKRAKDRDHWTLELEPTDDVLRALTAESTNGRVVVGFAAEAGADGLSRAREKRAVKKADLLVYNDVARSDIGFESPQNEVVIISEQGERRIERAPKARVAAEILDEVQQLLGSRA
jgi:phosphopantothenoylcysteine decarboxylase/phosphopantothenate--cysteine ligase